MSFINRRWMRRVGAVSATLAVGYAAYQYYINRDKDPLLIEDNNINNMGQNTSEEDTHGNNNRGLQNNNNGDPDNNNNNNNNNTSITTTTTTTIPAPIKRLNNEQGEKTKTKTKTKTNLHHQRWRT